MDVKETTERTTGVVDNVCAKWGPDLLRWVAALLWLGNVSWKRPPDFGRSGDSCRALCRFVEHGVEYPVLPGSSWLFEHVISPNLTAFGWVTILSEGTIAILLMSGRFRRIAGVAGVLMSVGILAAVANAPGEWYWSYLLMMLVNAAVVITAQYVAEPPAKTMAGFTIGFGAAMALVHIGEGFTGTAFTFFAGGEPLPNDLMRNLFGGSIALGLLIALVGAAGVVVSMRLPVDQQRLFGIGFLAVCVVGFLSYGPDVTVFGLGSTTTSACVIGALGLALAVWPSTGTPPTLLPDSGQT